MDKDTHTRTHTHTPSEVIFIVAEEAWLRPDEIYLWILDPQFIKMLPVNNLLVGNYIPACSKSIY